MPLKYIWENFQCQSEHPQTHPQEVIFICTVMSLKTSQHDWCIRGEFLPWNTTGRVSIYNVYISIMFCILCIHECVYMDRFLGSFLLNNDTLLRRYFAYCFVCCGGNLALQHKDLFLYWIAKIIPVRGILSYT